MSSNTRDALPYNVHGEVNYTDPNRVKGLRYQTDRTFPNPYADGYGPKVPTPYMVRYLGKGCALRWHRVYVMIYANSGSSWINVGGEVVFLDTETEYDLMEERDNVLAG